MAEQDMVRYSDRAEAGALLAAGAEGHLGRVDLVVGAARGGVVVAAPVAATLAVPLDVRVVRKLGAPGQPERAIGAVTPEGAVRWLEGEPLLPEPAMRTVLLDACAREAREREALYRSEVPRLSVSGLRVLLVDDGVATGATVMALVEGLRREGAAAVLLTLPVAPPETAALLEPSVEGMWIPHQPQGLWAVGMAYENFRTVTDLEVLACLREARSRQEGPSSRPPEAA